MSAYQALLGRIFSQGVEIELAGGLDFVGDLYARRNAATNRIEIWADVLPGATPGQIAIVSADGLRWEAGTPADVLRTGHDGTIGATAVAADAGETWLEVTRWPLANVVANAAGGNNTITVELTVTDGSGLAAPRDRAVMRVEYTRRDAGTPTLTNADDGDTSTSAAASVAWALELRAAAVADALNGTLETRVRLGAAGNAGQILLEARKHVDTARSVKGRFYFGVED